ncbi:MAG: hypothetical protein ACRC4M_02380 [Mycoplasma sp.]
MEMKRHDFGDFDCIYDNIGSGKFNFEDEEEIKTLLNVMRWLKEDYCKTIKMCNNIINIMEKNNEEEWE